MTEIQWPADCGPSERWTIYTRGNIGEIYPDVVLPLEWELGGRAAEQGWRTGAETIGFTRPEDYGPGDFVMMGVFGGYAYFNASMMRLLGVRTPGLDAEMMDAQFLGASEVAPYVGQPGDKSLRATAKVVGVAARTLMAKRVPLLEEMRHAVDAYRAQAPAMDASDDQLWGYLKGGLAELWEYAIASHVTISMQATIASGTLTDLCEKKLGDPNLAIALTTGIGDVVSAQPAIDMWRLANEVPDDDVEPGFADFLQRHGHRGPNEFSLVGRDWAAFPELARVAIDGMRGLDGSRSPHAQSVRLAQERERQLSDARGRLGLQARRLDRALASTALWSRAREESKNQVIRLIQLPRHAFLELLRRAATNGGVSDRQGPLLLNEDEFLRYLADPSALVATIERRRDDYRQLVALEPPFAFDAALGVPPPSTWRSRPTGPDAAADRPICPPGTVLRGAAGAPGIARGRARIVTDPGDPRDVGPGDVLVAALTDPAWTPLFVPAAAVVVEVGAAMSHSMIVARELGVPCVVGVENATQRIPDGAEVEVDGQAGTVRVL